MTPSPLEEMLREISEVTDQQPQPIGDAAIFLLNRWPRLRELVTALQAENEKLKLDYEACSAALKLACKAGKIDMANADRYRKALEEAEKLEGAYRMDPLEHAKNCLENVRRICREALTDHSGKETV